MIRTRSRRTTGRASRPTLVSPFGILALFAAALPLLAGASSVAAPTELKAKVVWVRGDRVYVASAESLAVEEGDLLTFRSGKKEIAAGPVADVRDPAMIVASLTSGSLRKEKKLDKIRIFAERPPLRPLPMLRVGCPSPSRPCLLFACERATIGASLPQGAYRADTLSQRSFRFVRDTTVALAAPWPDTLLVRAFDESADEEIALERGELDAAVFWPGELSRHMREDARWGRFLYGLRSSGSLWGTPHGEEGMRNTIDALNRAVFHGDLAMWLMTTAAPQPGREATIRIEADRAMPGFADIERALNRGEKSYSDSSLTRIFYQEYALPPKGQALTQTHPGAMPLSFIRCPIVSAAPFRATIRALDPNVFADLLGCGGSGSGR